MAIKVKHEGSVASRMAASAEGGRAKRAMEAAALVKPAPIQTLQPAHASAPGASAPHAQLIGAPGGGAHAQLIGGGGGLATLGGGGGRGVRGSGSSSSGGASPGGTSGASDYKITGSDPFKRPDEQSTWNPYTRQWIRNWLPGEKEAEAQQRVGDVKLEQNERAELSAQGRRERAALVNDVVESIKQGKFSKEEIPQLMKDFGLAEDTIRMADSLRDKSPTAEESFRKNTFTDANGVVFSRDGKMLYNPNDAKIKQAEFAAKQLDALKARADKFRAELMKPYKTSVEVAGLGGKKEIKDSYEMRNPEQVDALMQRYFPDLYPSLPAPAVSEGPIVVSPFDPLNVQSNPALNPAAAASQAPAASIPVPPTEGEAPVVAKTVEDAKKKWGVER